MRSTILLGLIWSLITVHAIGQNHPLVRTPAISPDGTQISFTYQGDIWKMPISGGQAQRLTIHESYESHPRWSPNGKKIVFQGSRMGNNDIFVMDADGGKPERLTYHSANDAFPRWYNDETILFSTRRAFAQVERENEIYSVSINNKNPKRYLDAVGLSPVPSPNTLFIAFVRGNCRISREAYQGPANRNIWIYQSNSKSYHQITDFEGQDIYPSWAGDHLYYLSAQNGRYNLYKQAISKEGTASGEAEALTSFTDEGISWYDLSANGEMIVFERGERIYSMKVGEEAKPISIKLSQDDRNDAVIHKTYMREATAFALSPNEKQMALVVRGELFVKQNYKDKKRTNQLTNHPFRDKEPVWVNDTTLIFVSDRGGNFDLYALHSNEDETDLYKSFSIETKRLTSSGEEEEDIHLSPDRKKIAFRRGRGKLVVADVAADGTLSNEKILQDGWATADDIAWSPDSKWLAYAMDDLDFNQEIYIQPADNSGKAVNVSLHPRGDNNPYWSKDGSKLGFISTRNNGDSDVWFVWLKKSDWEKTKRDWEDEEEPEPKNKFRDWGKKKDEEDKKEKEIEPIQIDFDQIHHRIEQVTRLAGNERDVTISDDGNTFYFTTNGGGRQGVPGPSDLMQAKWDGSELKTVISKTRLNRLQMDRKGEKLYAIKAGGNIVAIKLSEKKEEMLGFEAQMDIHPMEERKQVFEEAWRRLRDGFYDPEFHGQDWDALRNKYKNRCLNASTEQDFQTYYNEMLGQLNASHMGLRGGLQEDTQNERTGRLGIEMVPASGGVEIVHVVPSSAADRAESKLEVGEKILEVNGQAIGLQNINSFLNGKVNEKVQLTVVNKDGQRRKVIIRPSASIRSELYDAWVEDRKAWTDKYSNGRLGYIHIQGMNWPSFERFERELTASGLGKDGIVIDVRFNGGGWTTDMLMTVLNVRQHSFTIPRGAAKSLEKEKDAFRPHYPFGERLPLSSWTKPSVALCNENSYSNAEIFSHAYQALGHGTLVGRPTFGAVISTGGNGLLNGSFVRMPFRAWYVKSTNKNMEHGPAVPDIEVHNAPDSKANGEDPQLKRAVEELLKQIDG